MIWNWVVGIAVTKSTQFNKRLSGSDGKLKLGDIPISHLWSEWWYGIRCLLVLVFHHYHSCFGAFCSCYPYFSSIFNHFYACNTMQPSWTYCHFNHNKAARTDATIILFPLCSTSQTIARPQLLYSGYFEVIPII